MLTSNTCDSMSILYEMAHLTLLSILPQQFRIYKILKADRLGHDSQLQLQTLVYHSVRKEKQSKTKQTKQNKMVPFWCSCSQALPDTHLDTETLIHPRQSAALAAFFTACLFKKTKTKTNKVKRDWEIKAQWMETFDKAVPITTSLYLTHRLKFARHLLGL